MIRRRMRNSVIAVIMVFGLIALLGSCSKKGESAEGAKADAPKDETISFITWRGDDSEAYDKIIESFEAKYPNIKVNVEYLKGGTTYEGIVTTRGMGGELDFYAAQPGGQLAAYITGGYALDISDQDFINNVSPGAKAAGTMDGKTYGVAQATSTNCVFYNKEIFAKYGLTVPKTWDEFIAICDTLKANGEVPLVAGLSQLYIAQNFYKMMASHMVPDEAPYYWKEITDRERVLSDEPYPGILKDMESLFDKGYFIDGVEGIDKHGAAAIFAQSKAAMDVEGTWRTSTIADTEGAPDFGMFGLPYKGNPEEQVHVVAPNQTHLIFPQSKHIDACLLFYEHMMSPEMAKIFADMTGAVPTVNGTVVESPVTNMILDFINSTTPVLGPNLANTSNEVQQAIYETFTKVAVGLDTDDVIVEMQAKIDGIER